MFKILSTPLRTTRNTFRSNNPDLAYVYSDYDDIGYTEGNHTVILDQSITVLAVSSTQPDDFEQLKKYFFSTTKSGVLCSIFRPVDDDDWVEADGSPITNKEG